MIYRNLGKTGKRISAISFGGMRFEDQKNLERCCELIYSAHKLGINYFDTAPGYGNSEKIFAEAFNTIIKNSGRNSFFVATKTNSENAKSARRDLENSLKRLGLDYIDFYYVWCVMSYEDFCERRKNGVLREFEKFKEEGLIKHICFSTHMNGDEIEKTISEYHFEAVLLGYSAMNFNYREKGLESAYKKGLGIIVMNPLGGGIIPKNPEIFSFLKTQPDESVVEAALRFLLDDPRICSSLVGFANQKDLREAINAVNGYQKLAPADKERIKASLNEVFNQMCTGCRYCEPCPFKVPIPRLMDTYNQYILNGKSKEVVLNRLKWHWGIQANDPIFSACTKCGRCEKLCTQKIPIIQRIEEIKAIIK